MSDSRRKWSVTKVWIVEADNYEQAIENAVALGGADYLMVELIEDEHTPDPAGTRTVGSTPVV